ncbi:MAG: hypothetical protein KC646_00015 [Candidatus Cloacimonetes bacterium]|nr:hypothetical protein [Candidatus Cloacimonadota bacterium]
MDLKVKLDTQLRPEMVKTIKQIAKDEGRQIESLIEEALVDLVDKKKTQTPRRHVMTNYNSSHKEFSDLYLRLVQ